MDNKQRSRNRGEEEIPQRDDTLRTIIQLRNMVYERYWEEGMKICSSQVRGDQSQSRVSGTRHKPGGLNSKRAIVCHASSTFQLGPDAKPSRDRAENTSKSEKTKWDPKAGMGASKNEGQGWMVHFLQVKAAPLRSGFYVWVSSGTSMQRRMCMCATNASTYLQTRFNNVRRVICDG